MADIARRPAFVPRLPIRALALVALLIALVVVSAIYVGSQRRLPAPFGLAGNGLLAYTLDGDIYTRDPISNATRLIVGGEGVDGNIDFSPDGTRIGFIRQTPGRPGVQLMSANADGSGLLALTSDPIDDIPGWWFSPDGRSVAMTYLVGATTHAAIVRTDGSGRVELPIDALEGAAWRPPDGKELLVRGRVGEQTRLFIVQADGTAIHQLPIASTGIGGDRWDLSGPAWSPDGTRIAYNSVDQLGTDGSHFRVHVANADGTGDRTLPGPAVDSEHEGWPVWSPDGTTLFVERFTLGPNTSAIGLIPADGHDRGRYVGPRLSGEDEAFHVTWAPDQTRLLAFTEGSRTLLSIDPISGATTQLDWTTIETPDWQRVAR